MYEKQHNLVLMEHPPKQGLKRLFATSTPNRERVLMEHPPKQGLKPKQWFREPAQKTRF